MDFLQKHLSWFSKLYLRVQSKNCGRNSFFLFFFSEFFSNFERNIFRLSAKKLQENVKTTFCVSGRTICSLKKFLKVLHRFGFSAKNFGIGTCSQNSIYVSRVKIAEEIFFFILPFYIFSDFERKIFETFGQKTSRICQNYLMRVQRNNL